MGVQGYLDRVPVKARIADTTGRTPQEIELYTKRADKLERMLDKGITGGEA